VELADRAEAVGKPHTVVALAVDCATYASISEDLRKRWLRSRTSPERGGATDRAPFDPSGAELAEPSTFSSTMGTGQSSGSFVSAVVRSPLFGSDLRAFYDPVLTGVGCSFDADSIGIGQTRC